MKVPKKVLIIGAAHLLQWHPKGKAHLAAKNKSMSNYVMATNAAHTMLYLFPNKTQKTLKDRRGMEIKYDIPTLDITAVGSVYAVQYSTDWWENETLKYEHMFSDAPTLYADHQSRFKVIGIKPKRGKILTVSGVHG